MSPSLTPEQRRAIPEDVIALCRHLHDAGHRGWIVGGCIRDVLLGRGAQVVQQPAALLQHRQLAHHLTGDTPPAGSRHQQHVRPTAPAPRVTQLQLMSSCQWSEITFC